MMRFDRILRDSADAGAVNAQVALWGFVDEHTFLTKAGHVGVVYRIRGQDTEALHAFERVWSTLVAGLKGESWNKSAAVIKESAPPRFPVCCARRAREPSAADVARTAPC